MRPKSPLPPPSPEAARQLRAMPIDLNSGEMIGRGPNAFQEYFRLDVQRRLHDTRHVLVDAAARAAQRSPADAGGL